MIARSRLYILALSLVAGLAGCATDSDGSSSSPIQSNAGVNDDGDDRDPGDGESCFDGSVRHCLENGGERVQCWREAIELCGGGDTGGGGGDRDPGDGESCFDSSVRHCLENGGERVQCWREAIERCAPSDPQPQPGPR